MLAIVTYFGLDYLPLIMVFSVIFLFLLLWQRRTLLQARPAPVSKGSITPTANPKGAHLSVGLTVATVIMRSWTHFGLMAYIPLYYINYLKMDPLYPGALVSVFLVGGAVGTLAGAPLADRWGHKRYLVLSLALTSVMFPLIFVTNGFMLFVSMGAIGMALISSFTVTMVMAQECLPRNLGVASGLMAGFAIGTGGIGVTLLGVIADHFGLPVALKSIMVLPLIGLLIRFFIRYPLSPSQLLRTDQNRA